MSAKPFPPYRLEGSGNDAWIVDNSGNDVAHSIQTTYHYAAVFYDGELMRILCDAMNREAAIAATSTEGGES